MSIADDKTIIKAEHFKVEGARIEVRTWKGQMDRVQKDKLK